MYTDTIQLEIEQVKKYLHGPGPVYVLARIEVDNAREHRLKVVKAEIIQLLSAFKPDTKIGYATFNDGGKYPAILLSWKDRK